jgi:hypothetical protein
MIQAQIKQRKFIHWIFSLDESDFHEKAERIQMSL